MCLYWSVVWFIGAIRTRTTTNTRAILWELIVTVVSCSRNILDLLLIMKKITADNTTKDLHLTMTILHLLQPGIETVVFSRQTPGSVLQRKVLLVGKTFQPVNSNSNFCNHFTYIKKPELPSFEGVVLDLIITFSASLNIQCIDKDKILPKI